METTDKADFRELMRINAICDKWWEIDAFPEMWKVTLKSGKTMVIHTKLGAAVEIEENGHTIIVYAN